MKSDHIKRMITLTGDNIKRLSLYFIFFQWRVAKPRRIRTANFPLLSLEKHTMDAQGTEGMLFKGHPNNTWHFLALPPPMWHFLFIFTFLWRIFKSYLLWTEKELDIKYLWSDLTLRQNFLLPKALKTVFQKVKKNMFDFMLRVSRIFWMALVYKKANVIMKKIYLRTVARHVVTFQR